MHRDGRAFCSVLLLPRAPDTAPRPLSVHTRPGRTPTARAERGHPGGPQLRPEPARPPSCQDGVRTAAEGAGRTGCGLGGCGPAAQTGPGSSRTRVSPEHRPPGEAAGDAAPDGPCTPQPPAARGPARHRCGPHSAQLPPRLGAATGFVHTQPGGGGSAGGWRTWVRGGPCRLCPSEAQRGGGSAPLGDTRRRDRAPRPPVRTETRACPGARGVRGVPRLERARAGTTQGGRATGRLGSRPSGSRPSLQPHCVHVARAMGRRPPEARPPGRVASPVRARACRAAGPPTAACTILAVRPGLR